MFYQIYAWQFNWFGKSNNPASVAIMVLSFNVLIVLLAIETIVFIFFDSFKVIMSLSKGQCIGVSIFILAIHYFIFMHKRKYIGILKEYKKKYKNNAYYAIAIASTPGLLFVILMIAYSFIRP